MYAKVFSQMYDGTLCTKGPWQALVTFQQLLILADQEGNVDMTASAIARRTTIPLEIIEMGIAVLLEEDAESRTPTEQGRRILPLSDGRSWGWHIVNYQYYRSLKREEDRREYHRNYWHSRKEKELNNSTLPQPAQPNQPIAEAKAEAKAKKTPPASPSFVLPDWIPEDTWAAYMEVRKAKKATKTIHALELIVKDLEAFKAIGHHPRDVLNNSIKSGWVGVFEPKTRPTGVVTVPSTPGRDPALLKLEEDDRRAAPPSIETLARLAELRRPKV